MVEEGGGTPHVPTDSSSHVQHREALPPGSLKFFEIVEKVLETSLDTDMHNRTITVLHEQ